jgi:hypothetical protein
MVEVYEREERRLDSRLSQLILLRFKAPSSLLELTQIPFQFLLAVVF